MLKTREWLLVIAIAIIGAAATMIYRVVVYAARLAYGVAVQSITMLVFWAAIGLVAVMLLRWRTAARRQE